MPRSMKLLCVLPRFGRHVTGGAEGYVHALLREWVRRGHEARVLTTFSDRIELASGYRIEWPPRPDLAAVEEWDGITIERFPVRTLSWWERALADGLAVVEDRRRGIFDARLRGSGVFVEGWWGPGVVDGHAVVGTAGPSVLRPPPGSRAIDLEIRPTHGGRVAWDTGPWRGESERLTAGVWRSVRIAPVGDEVIVRYLSPRPFLGRGPSIAVRRIRVWRGGAAVDLWNGRDTHQTAAGVVRDTAAWGGRRHPIEEIGSRKYRGPDSPALMAALRRRMPSADAVVAGYFPFTLPAAAQGAARRAGHPFFLLPFAHANDPSHHSRWQHRLLRDATGVFALSDFNRRAYFDPLGARAVTIGGGASHICAAPVPGDVAAFRAAHGIPPDAVVVLTVARKTAYKAYGPIVAAVDEAARSGTRLVALWVGPDEDRQVVESRHWRYAGRLDDRDLCTAYRASDIFCLFSEYESFGMVVLDAACHGLPVVVNRRCGPTTELVEDGVTGCHADPEELATVLRTLATDPERRRALGDRGRVAAMGRRTWEATADRFEAAVTGAVERRTA